MINIIAYILVIILASVIVLLLINRVFPKFKIHLLNHSRKKKTIITENIVTEIKKIGKYCPMIYYDEIVICARNYKQELDDLKITLDDIAIIAKGRAYAEIDLTRIEESDVIIKDNSLIVKIPRSSLSNINLNPKDYTIIPNTKKWSDIGINFLLEKGEEIVKTNVRNSNFLKKSDEEATRQLKEFLSWLGFTNVDIFFNEDDSTEHIQNNLLEQNGRIHTNEMMLLSEIEDITSSIQTDL